MATENSGVLIERENTPAKFDHNLIEAYWENMADELNAKEKRINNLIHNRHHLIAGQYKERLLRNIIRRHLPEQYKVCTGFIRTADSLSTEIDILIIDRSSFTIFKEDDFVIVTPSAVKAIIEVKGNLQKSKIDEVLDALAKNVKMVNSSSVWSGLFAYRSHPKIDQDTYLTSINNAYEEHKSYINCISDGPAVGDLTSSQSTFIRYWEKYEDCSGWTSYSLGRLSPAYFIGNLITHLTFGLTDDDFKTIFAIKGTKEIYRKKFIEKGGREIKELETR